MKNYFVKPTGDYYEGDQAHILDLLVSQRPSHFHSWDFQSSSWILDQAAKDADDAAEARKQDLENISKQDSVINQIRTVSREQITDYINSNVTDLASARAYLVKLTIAVQYILRNERE